MTPRAIDATPSTASCSAHVRTWPVSVMTESAALAWDASPHFWTRVDRDYETLRIDMQTLFHDLGITPVAAAA